MALPKRSSQINLVKDSRLLVADLKMERVIMSPRLVLTMTPMIANTERNGTCL